MHKRLLIIILIFYSAIVAAENYPQYGLGVKGGTSWNSIYFYPSVQGQTYPLTWHAGLQFRMVHKKYFGIKTELLYTQKGFADGKEAGNLRRLDYVELPLLSHFTFGEKLFRFYIDFGPYIAVLVNDTEQFTLSEPQHTYPSSNRFDYGLGGGLGFEFNTKGGIIFVEGRYNFGFGSFIKTTASDYFSTAFNQNITLSLGYLIKI